MRRTSIALAVLATVVTTAYADVYKSIDAQGQVHYSDQWTPGAQLIQSSDHRVVPDTPPPSAPATNDHTLATDATKAATAKQVQADVDAVRAEQCKQLKDQYDKLIHARRIYQPSSDSSAPREYMTDAQADAERVKTRQAMDEACAGASGN